MPEIDRVVVLSEGDAQLLVHVLAAFERLLLEGRAGDVSAALGAARRSERADVEIAEVVVEAGEPLRRQP